MVLIINKNTKKEEFDKFMKDITEKSIKGFNEKVLWQYKIFQKFRP